MNEAPPRLLFPALKPLYLSLEPFSWLLVRCACGVILALRSVSRPLSPANEYSSGAIIRSSCGS